MSQKRFAQETTSVYMGSFGDYNVPPARICKHMPVEGHWDYESLVDDTRLHTGDAAVRARSTLWSVDFFPTTALKQHSMNRETTLGTAFVLLVPRQEHPNPTPLVPG